jgi:cytochrome c553
VAQQVAATTCASCHGPNGISTSPLFPRLAGQQELYLAAQLRAFKARTRGEQDAHDYTWGMATLLDETVIDALARYYAAQKPAPGTPGNAALIARGKLLSSGAIRRTKWFPARRATATPRKATPSSRALPASAPPMWCVSSR